MGTTLEVSSKTKVKTFEVEGSQVEMFMVLSDANGFQYTLTVTKSIDDEIVFKDFKDDK